jgi:RNA polymerase sigma-70 factor (ECF subfamily)
MGPPSPRRPSPGPFDALYREHVRYVAGLVHHCCVREADVNDLVQEVFILFYRAFLDGLDTSRPLRKWLRRTCVRKVRDHRKLLREREQPAREGALELADVVDVAPTPEDVSMEISAWKNVDAVLDRLPQEQRIVFVMSELEEMPNREIAEDLEIPEGTVATRLAAARKSARRAWDERRASGLMSVAPFALWDFDALLKHGAAPPPLPPGFEEDVWRGLVQRIPELAAGGVAVVVGTAAAKAGAMLTVKQAAAGFALSALLGAGIVVLVTGDSLRESGMMPAPTSSAVAMVPTPASASASAAPPPVVVVAPTSTASASASAAGSVSPEAIEANDRMLLEKARSAIDRGDYAGARASLLRVKSQRFAPERDMRLRDVAAHLDGGR